jgi:phage repressor protein C with HTH and peptisase S24 domain
MIEHMNIWLAIDRLAAVHGLSASGLSKKAGLDPTSFNPSKRTGPGGKLRWPTTESISKILAATGTNFSEFVSLVEREDFSPSSPAELAKMNYGSPRTVPVLSLAEAGEASAFDSNGFPVAADWDEVAIPSLDDPNAYALTVAGKDFAPAYRDGDILIISPQAPIRKGDRVVIKTAAGKILVREVVKKTATRLEVTDLSGKANDNGFAMKDLAWFARIMWVSQ